jgi:hypothetical protein
VAGCIIIAGAFVLRTRYARTTPHGGVPTVTAAPKDMRTWEDPAGFSFSYPSDLSVNKHDEDMENYAHLEFTSNSHAGNIIIWAKDTTYRTVSDWLSEDTLLHAAPFVDTTLGGKQAKKIVLSGATKKIIIGTIDEDVLVTIEADVQTEESYWQEISTGIAQTFVFSSFMDNGDAVEQTADEENYMVDEEEILE